jgi:hypothetical protein
MILCIEGQGTLSHILPGTLLLTNTTIFKDDLLVTTKR